MEPVRRAGLVEVATTLGSPLPAGAALAVAALADPLDGHGDAGVGEAELGILDQVADDGGTVAWRVGRRSTRA
jgi:hypothetical protein